MRDSSLRMLMRCGAILIFTIYPSVMQTADASPACLFLSGGLREQKRADETFDVKKFAEAKSKYVELFKDRTTSAELIENSQFPRSGEEFLAFLEASVEWKLPGALKPSDAWTDPSLSGEPRVRQAQKKLIQTLQVNLPWANARINDGKVLLEMEVPQSLSFKQTMKLYRELYKTEALISAVRRGEAGYISGIFNLITGKALSSSAKNFTFWQRVSERHASKIDRLIDERIINEMIEYDVIPALQRTGFVGEFLWSDGISRTLKQHPTLMSVAKQSALQFATLSAGLGFFPVVMPPVRTFGRSSLDRNLRNSLEKNGFNVMRDEIRKQLGNSPQAEYMIGQARVVFATVAAAVIAGVIYNQLNSPDGQRFLNIARVFWVDKDDLKTLEENQSDAELRKERFENAVETFEIMYEMKIDAASRRIAAEISKEVNAENRPNIVLPNKADLLSKGDRDSIVFLVNHHYYWHHVVKPEDLRFYSAQAAPLNGKKG